MIEVGYPERMPIFNEQQYLNFIAEWNHKKNIYRSVYSFQKFTNHKPDYSITKIDKIFFDFDEDTHEIVKKFVTELRRDNLRFRVNFSGRRGFHVYIRCAPRDIDRKSYLLFLHNHLIKQYALEKYDVHVIGNIRQLARIENSYNIAGQCYCIPLKYDEIFLTFEEIKVLAQQPRLGQKYWIGDGILDIEMQNYEAPKAEVEIQYKDNLLPDPCILRILNIVHPSHEERFLLALWLSNEFRKGRDINLCNLDELAEMIITRMRGLNWDDYSEALNTAKSTRYQVFNIINKRFNYVPNCDWRRTYNICCSEPCHKEKCEKYK